jgi:hypothetical protein
MLFTPHVIGSSVTDSVIQLVDVFAEVGEASNWKRPKAQIKESGRIRKVGKCFTGSGVKL